MRRYVFRLAILTLAALFPAVVRAGDQEIAQQIVQKLQAEKQAGELKGFSIDLSVEEGTVWLSGRVADADQQAKALDIARRIPGVKQVVNDLSVAPPAKVSRNPLASMTSAVQRAMGRQTENYEEQNYEAQPAAATEESGPIGSGVQTAGGSPLVQVAQPMPNNSAYYAQAPQAYQAPVARQAGGNQMPLAFAPASQVAYNQAGVAADGYTTGGPTPMHFGGSGVGIAPARYDHPSMPGYAWPSYAAHPNYAAVTYPKQYSPTAWPYIGPFYPYPQVPLGWRKVTLEWDDGWWMLDFKDRRH
jgi:hypothetical protein